MSREIDLDRVAEAILQDVIQWKEDDESLLFFTDSLSRWDTTPHGETRHALLHELYEAFRHATRHGRRVVSDKYEATRHHGAEPRENIWRLALGTRSYDGLVASGLSWRLREGVRLRDAEWSAVRSVLERYKSDLVCCVVAFPWFSTTHSRFRRLLCAAGARYLSLPTLTRETLAGSLSADWRDVEERTALLYGLLRGALSASIYGPSGTRLDFDVLSVGRDKSRVAGPGEFGNLPAGETYLVPVAGSARGQVVVSAGAMGEVTISVDEGKVVDLEGAPTARQFLDQHLASDVAMRGVAELGLGTNPFAQRTDEPFSPDLEKALGTAHLALGDNSAMGGAIEAPEHVDLRVRVSCLEVSLRDSSTVAVLKDGRLLIPEPRLGSHEP